MTHYSVFVLLAKRVARSLLLSVVELAFLWVSLLTEHILLPQVSVSFSLFSWLEKPPHIFYPLWLKRTVTKWNSGEKHKKCQDFFPNVNLRMPGEWRMRHATFFSTAPSQTEWHGFALPLTSFNRASWAERQGRTPLSLKLNIFNLIHVCAWDRWERYSLKYFCSAPSNFVAATESLWLK